MVRSRFIVSLAVLGLSTLCGAQQAPATSSEMADAAQLSDTLSRYSTDDWLTIAPHLPDPKTSKPEQLQTAGDVLRARRFPEEAIRYYHFAMDRGGDTVVLLNRIGVTELDLGQAAAARIYFHQATVLKKKYAEAWNNLGATENLLGNYAAAINDYQHAIKINRKNATFHANLGTAYFAHTDYESGRHEYEIAVRLDNNILRRSGVGGTMVQVLSGTDRGRFAFEMARLAAAHDDQPEMLHWLQVAAEAGFDLGDHMKGSKEFQPYLKDERVKLIFQNIKAMHSRQIASVAPVPQLPAPDSEKTRE